MKRNSTISKQENKTSTPSISSAIKETLIAGFGLGIGSELANRAVAAVLGPRQIEVQSDKSKNDRCQEYLQKYEKCFKDNNCGDELEKYQQCLKSI